MIDVDGTSIVTIDPAGTSSMISILTRLSSLSHRVEPKAAGSLLVDSQETSAPEKPCRYKASSYPFVSGIIGMKLKFHGFTEPALAP